MMPEALAGRKGKQPDGTAKTRQVYLGCVFTQHRTDEQGRPVRDWASTTYVSTFKPVDDFGPLLRQEALRRGWEVQEWKGRWASAKSSPGEEFPVEEWGSWES